MIFVTVGTSHVPFDRLLRALDLVGGSERLLVQHGASEVRPSRADLVAFLPFDEVIEHMRAARVVVTHAGVGSVMAALTAGKRPVVMPRLRSFRETADDHQVELARRLARADLVTLVDDPSELPTVVGRDARPVPTRSGTASPLIQELSAYLHSVVPKTANRVDTQA